MLTLLLGSGAAKAISILCIPILTRLYSPDDYGVLAAYSSIVLILLPALNFRYVLAIPLPKNDKIAVNIMTLSLLFICVMTVSLSMVLALFHEALLSKFSLDRLNNWWFIIPLGIFGNAVYELLSTWSTRKKNYKLIANTQFKQSLVGNLVKIVLGILSFSPFGLLFGHIVTQSAGVSSLFRDFYQKDRGLIKFVSWKKVNLVFKYFKGFLVFRFPSQFIMALASQAPILIMAKNYSSYETGQLSLAMMALAMPVGLLGQAIAKAYYAEVAAIGKKNISEIKHLTIAIQKKLLVIGGPISLALFFGAELLFQLMFGDEWKLSGTFASILAPYILIQFTSSPLIQVLNVIGSQFYFLLINTVRLIGIAAIYYYGVHFDITATDFVKLVSGWMFIFYLAITCIILSYVHVKAK